MKIGLLQFKTNDGDSLQTRFDRLLQQLGQVDDCELLVLPELWLHSAFGSWAEENNKLENIADYIATLTNWASQNNTWLCTGSFLVKSLDGKTRNTSYLISNEGKKVLSYSKRHLFGIDSQEAHSISKGDRRSELDTKFGKIGMAICYDLRFPEHFRSSRHVPEIFIVPCAWPSGRIKQFKTLVSARAIENQSFVIACNGVGKQGQQTLGGNSQVIDFEGKVVLNLESDEEIAYANIEIDKLRVYRRKFDFLRDRLDL